MRSNISENILYINLPDKISAQNADEFEKELLELTSSDDFAEIVLDASELTYISSMGLRALLKLKHSARTPIRITEVSLEAYEIFEITGYTDIFTIEKALGFVDTAGLVELGRGMYGSVYRVDDEKVLKVFHGVSSREGLDAILRNIRTAFVGGIPTIIPFETVKTDSGLGMMFELVNTMSLADLIHEHPEDIKRYAGNMVELAKIMAKTEFADGTLRSRKELLREELEAARYLFTDSENEELMRFLDAVPERNTAVHGDFHGRNIYLSDGKALLIDMDDFSMGHPIWDIACLYRVYPYLIELDERTYRPLFGIDDSVYYPDFYYQVMHLSFDEGIRLWECFVKEYFADYSDDEISGFLELAKFYSDFMVIRFLIDECHNVKDDEVRLTAKIAIIRELLDGMRGQNLDELIAYLEAWR